MNLPKLTWLIDFLASHPGWSSALVAGSIAMLIGSMLALPWIIIRLPSDYLVRQHPPVRHPVIWIVRNLVGTGFLLAGAAMLVLPGQGILTMLAGLALTTLPGRRRLVAWVVRRARLLASLNRIRQRAGVEPLVGPQAGSPDP